MNIFVGNLNYQTDDLDLRARFEEFGTVDKAVVIIDKQTGRSRGYGFVEMPDHTEAMAAISAVSESEFMGRKVTCNEALERGSGRGGPGGGDERGRHRS